MKITCHQHSIEVILANEDFILGSDPNDYLESALDENYDDFLRPHKPGRKCYFQLQ